MLYALIEPITGLKVTVHSKISSAETMAEFDWYAILFDFTNPSNDYADSGMAGHHIRPS